MLIIDPAGKVTGIITADDRSVLLAREVADPGAGTRENVEVSERR